jgi:UDP-3-O-[3-hydroxymyristoyl] glucosamine N-acyltransferase
MLADSVFIHDHALVESDTIGAGTRVWAFAPVMAGARIGRDCNVCDHTYIEDGVEIGPGAMVGAVRGRHRGCATRRGRGGKPSPG